MTNTVIARVPVGAILALRHRVLRSGMPAKTAHFPGDDEPTTWHFAAFLLDWNQQPVGEAICCASFVQSSFADQEAWRLRGMATAPECQRQGIGQELLEFAEERLSGLPGPRLLWCDAREAAIGFYQRYGWHCVSDVFDIPSAGPHRKMIKRI